MNEKIKFKSKLSVRFLLISILAFFISFLVYYLISNNLANWVFESDQFYTYWESKSNHAVQQFQEYVSQNQLSAEEAVLGFEWDVPNSEIILFIQPLEKNIFTKQDTALYDQALIECTDGTVCVAFYSPGDSYYKWWNMFGILVGFACFFCVLIPYTFFILSRMQNLCRQVRISIKEDDYTIHLNGNDEIAKLGEEINTLKQTLMKHIRQEEAIKRSNYHLVASLSHDIRTPLTKLIGYLEILKHTDADTVTYLDKIYEKAIHLKSLTDELFYQFSSSRSSNISAQLVYGYKLFSQLLYGWCEDLKSEGYCIQQEPLPYSDYLILVRLKDIHRIFDNIFTNIKKYADINMPIEMYTHIENGQIILCFKNHKNLIQTENSHNIGLINIQTLMKENNGTMRIKEEKSEFTMTIAFPVKYKQYK